MHRRSVRTAVVTVGAVLLTGVLLSACAAVPPLERLTLANAKTADAGTARMVLAIETTWPLPFGDRRADITVDAEGVVDFAHNRIQVTQKTSSRGIGLSREIIADDQALYMKSPLAQKRGKTWLEMDLSRGITPVMAVSLGQVPAPAATLAFLESVSSEIRQVGTEAIRGTPTTHYAVTIEAKQALERQGLTERQRKRMAQALAGANLDSFPADVWIDGGDRLRKLHFRVEPDGKDGVQSETTLELFDFGGPPAVEPPPADQVLPISDTEAFFPGQDLEKTRKEFEERIQEFLNKAPKNSPSG